MVRMARPGCARAPYPGLPVPRRRWRQVYGPKIRKRTQGHACMCPGTGTGERKLTKRTQGHACIMARRTQDLDFMSRSRFGLDAELTERTRAQARMQRGRGLTRW